MENMQFARLSGWTLTLLALAVLATLNVHSTTAQQQVTVALAERTKWYGPTNGGATTPGVVVPSSDDHIVLVLTLKGFGPEDWKKLDLLAIRLTAGESRYNCQLKKEGRVAADGSLHYDDHRVVFLVPKATNMFVLHLPPSMAIQFSVSGPIKPNIEG